MKPDTFFGRVSFECSNTYQVRVPITRTWDLRFAGQALGGQQTVGCARRAADRAGLAGSRWPPWAALIGSFCAGGGWPRGLCGFVSR